MIHVENLTKNYKELCAVDGINFDVQKGEILGLLGPNGAGKTTTLRMLTGFLRPTAGSIRVKEYNIEEQALEIKRIMGYLPESAPLYHEMLVYDYLDYIANIREIKHSRKLPRIRQLADLCGLNSVMHQPVSELSKGFKQRVGLAHAMMNDPEILVLDEPTSGLDPNQIAEIREIIKRIGKQKTIIISTHILSEAEATCDRIVIISNGKIVADGGTESLKQSISSRTFMNISVQNAGFEAVKQQLSKVEGVEEVARISENDGVLKVKLSLQPDMDLRQTLYLGIKETDWILLEFYQETQTLEDIFRKLTKEN